MDELNLALASMIQKELIEVSVDENGEFIFWMTQEQKERAKEELNEEL